MIKGFLLLSIGATLYASSDYMAFSKFSEDEQIKNNFIKLTQTSNEIIKITENKKQIPVNITQKKDLNINPEIVNKYKNENILKDEVKYTKDSFRKDFSITPKLTYSYLKHDGDYPEKVALKDNTSVLVPEISLSYKKHTLKAEWLKTKAHIKGVIIDGTDLDTKTSWYKLNYLYKYKNANIGLAYNYYKTKWNLSPYNIDLTATEEKSFPSLEAHLKNEKDELQVEYGLSFGKSGSIDIAYEYYVNLGYKVFRDDGLIISAGYKNRAIDFDSLKFEYSGPTLSLSTTF